MERAAVQEMRPREDAGVARRVSIVHQFPVGIQETGARLRGSSLRVLSRLGQKIPGLELHRDDEVVMRSRLCAMQQRDLESNHCVGGPSLPSAGARDGDHPLRIVIRELIKPRIVRCFVIEASQRILQGCLGDVPVDAIAANGEGVRVGCDCGRRIAEHRLRHGQVGEEAGVARRSAVGCGEEVEPLLLSLSAERE
jgi:hypothetical protein